MAKTNRLDRDSPIAYQITVQGCLDDTWSDWFDGLTIRCLGDGRTLIEGQFTDQPALHGVLKKIRDLGLPLLMVTQI